MPSPLPLPPVMIEGVDPPLISCSSEENSPCTSLGQPHKSDIVDLPQEHEHERSGPAPHLPYGDVDGTGMHHLHSSRPVAGVRAGPDVIEARDSSCPLPASALRRGSLDLPWV